MSSLLIRNARLVPIGAGDPVPDGPVDVAIEHGVVTAVGPDVERPSGAEVIDADGRWLIPGLWDQHVHLGQWTLTSQRLDLAGAHAPEDATRAVAERIAAYPGQPVIGWGHRSAGWDREVTVSELDAVSGDTTVVLISGDGHHAWLNTSALMHLAMPVRDSVVREAEWFATYPRLVTLVGSDAYRFLAREHVLVAQLSDTLKVRPEQLPERVNDLVEKLRSAEKEIEKVRVGQLLAAAGELAAGAAKVGPVNLVAHRADGAGGGDVRTLALDVRGRLPQGEPGVVVVIGAADGKVAVVAALNDEARARGLSANDLVRVVGPLVGGKGGGKDDVAQGGGTDASRIDEAIALVTTEVGRVAAG